MSGRVTTGHAIGGRFVVARWIGSGPMGEVLEVRDQGSGVAYACKLLFPAVAQSTAWAAHQDEARRASALGAGVARVLETGYEAQAQSPFVLSELMPSPSLAARVASAPLTPHAAAAMVRGLVGPLGTAHSAGIAHRDLVPTNVFLDDANAVRLTDFAIATLRAAVPPAQGAFPLGWVPPEQVQGAPPAPTMDVYGVGLLTFFALTGRSPFLALAQPTLDANALWTEMTSPLPPLSERAKQLGAAAPPALDAWFARALAVDPGMRFPSVREMADAMETALGPAPGAPKGKGLHGTMLMGGDAASIAAQLELRKQMQMATAPTQAQASYGTPAPAPVPAGLEAPPPAAMPAAPVTYGGDEPAGVPKKGGKGLVIALVGIGGVVVVGGLVGLFFFLRSPKAPDAPASDSPAATTSAEPAPAASDSAAAAETPPASGSAAPATGAPDSLVTVKCDPECDEVKCDGKKIDAAAGDRFKPGKHSCTATKKGYVPATDRFTTKAGEDAPRTVTLTKLPDAKATGTGTKKCKGTFISNCN